MPHRIWTTLLLATLFCAPAQAAKLYKWTDEEGNVHYGQQLPSSNTEEVIKQPQPEVEPEVVDKTPIEVPEPTDLAASQQAADLCERLYRDLELYKGHAQITDEEGNVMIVSPEMREAKTSEINAQLNESCR